MTRSATLEMLRLDYVRTARAKGLTEKLVIYRHVLKNALIPVVTVIGLQTGTLLGGAVLTEIVFARYRQVAGGGDVGSAYYGGKVDFVVQRFVDTMLAFPGDIIGVGLHNMMIAVGITTIPDY